MQTEIRNGTLYISGDVTVKTLTASAFARYEQQCRLKVNRQHRLQPSRQSRFRLRFPCCSTLCAGQNSKPTHSKHSRFRPRTGRTLRNQRLVAIMKKTTASPLPLSSALPPLPHLPNAIRPTLTKATIAPFPSSTTKQTNTSLPL